MRGGDARPIDAQGPLFLDQAEFHGIPVDPGKLIEHSQRPGAQTALAIGLDEIGQHRIHEHRYMAEHVMEDIRLLQVIELVGIADEAA